MSATIAIDKVMKWTPDKRHEFVGAWAGKWPEDFDSLDEWAFYLLRCLPLDRIDVLFSDGELTVAGAGEPRTFDLKYGYPRAIVGAAAYCRMRGIPALVASTGLARMVKLMAETAPDWRCPDCGGSILRGTNRHESPHFHEGQCTECDGVFRLGECVTEDDDQ